MLCIENYLGMIENYISWSARLDGSVSGNTGLHSVDGAFLILHLCFYQGVQGTSYIMYAHKIEREHDLL